MENKNFKSSISGKFSAGDAVKMISNIPGWWGVSFSGSAEKQGDKFKIGMPQDAYIDYTVTESIPGRRVVWLATDSYLPWYADKTEWTNTRLIFDLKETNGETEVTFTHEGLTPEVECYKDCEQGWTHWIKTSLFSYLTTGKGVFRQPTK